MTALSLWSYSAQVHEGPGGSHVAVDLDAKCVQLAGLSPTILINLLPFKAQASKEWRDVTNDIIGSVTAPCKTPRPFVVTILMPSVPL